MIRRLFKSVDSSAYDKFSGNWANVLSHPHVCQAIVGLLNEAEFEGACITAAKELGLPLARVRTTITEARAERNAISRDVIATNDAIWGGRFAS